MQTSPDLIRLTSARAVAGYAHGFSYPHRRVFLQLRKDLNPGTPDFLQGLFQRLLRRDLVLSAARHRGSLRLAAWIIDIHAVASQACHSPVLEKGLILGAEAHGEHADRVAIALPCLDQALAERILGWIMTVFAQLHDGMSRPGGPDRSRMLGWAASFVELQNHFGPLGLRGVNVPRYMPELLRERIPFRQIAPQLLAIGQGVHSRWLRSTFTDQTSHLGATIARRKHLASAILRNHGIPVPEFRLAGSADAAVGIARGLGFPVVVKVADLDGGIGVHAGLRDEEQVRLAWADARQHGEIVMVERHVSGNDYRMTVFRGRLRKATLRTPGGVTGNGRDPVRVLIERANASPETLERIRERGPKVLLQLDAEALSLLSEAGLSPESVLEEGRFAAIRRRANISTGGTTTLVTALVHPDNRRLAERAATALRLDLAGVDLLIPDISVSWLESGAAICEVNAQPQLSDAGSPGLYADILKTLLGGEGRVPIVLVLFPADGERERLQNHGELQNMVEALPPAWRKGLVVAGSGRVTLDGVDVAMPGMRAEEIVGNIAQLPWMQHLLIGMSVTEVQQSGAPSDRLDGIIVAPGDGEDQTPSGQHSSPLAQQSAIALCQALGMLAPHLDGRLVVAAAADGTAATISPATPAFVPKRLHPRTACLAVTPGATGIWAREAIAHLLGEREPGHDD